MVKIRCLFSRSSLRMKGFWWLALLLAPLHADLAKQWDKEIVPILETYCFDCHADGVKKGDFSFDATSR